MSNKIWYLPGPFHQYQEDVKALAKAAGLRIIDANATGSREGEAVDVPDVTLRDVDSHQVVIVGGGDPGQLEELIARLNIERDLIVALIESAEGLSPLVQPEAGELPIRLFDALSGIHQGITSLKAERDGLATEAEGLRGQIASLKAAATKLADEGADSLAELTAAQLKEQLEAKGITYKSGDLKPELLALLKAAQ